jgi:hypothetical protein
VRQADQAEQRRKPARVVRLHPGAKNGSDLPPLLAPGSYEAAIIGVNVFTVKMWGGATKLAVAFDVVREGLPPARLHAFYNYDRDKRKPFRKHSRFARDWRTVTGRRESRREKMAPQSMVGAFVHVTVRTVDEVDGRRLSLPNQYSVVDYIEDVIAGGHQSR